MTQKKLADTPKKFWANMILWRLAVAEGLVSYNEAQAYIDADEVLEKAEDYIDRYINLAK